MNGIVFSGSAFTITITGNGPGLIIFGVGITNNSGVLQNFVVPNSGIEFWNSATAGSLTAFTNGGNGLYVSTDFRDNSTAGNGTFTNNGLGNTVFEDNSTAGNGTFTNNGGSSSGARGGLTLLTGYSTAGNGTFIANAATASGSYDAYPGGADSVLRLFYGRHGARGGFRHWHRRYHQRKSGHQQ